ncbi:MAG: NYN domain-containing protein [Planctomycetia bacterium]|nr:NYN domain-containing protein [Planctomycetia bacterium]
MPLLIDGYNLMYAAGIVGLGRGAGGLERSRAALIRFVGETLDPAERGRTIVVFDAAGAPPGLPSSMFMHGVAVRFAKGYNDADELLEELIAADHTPRRLTVVSSDHRIQRAARRRRATAVDSDVWYESVLRKRSRGTSHTDEETNSAKYEGAEKPLSLSDRKRNQGLSNKGTSKKDSRAKSSPQKPAIDPPSKAKLPPVAHPPAHRIRPDETPERDVLPIEDAELQFWLHRIVDDDDIAEEEKWGSIFPPGYAEDEEEK